MIIKLVLLAGLAGAAVMLVRGRPTALNLLVRRALTLATIVAGAIAVLVPSLLEALLCSAGCSGEAGEGQV